MGQLKSELPSKYATRKEQLMNYAAFAGELPTELYKIINITNTNYRMYLSRLRNENTIRTIKSDGLTGYALTNMRKRELNRNVRYYGNLAEANMDVRKRKRMQNFAMLYAAFDLQNIEYEPYSKPIISQDIPFVTEEILFYTAYEFKKTQNNNGITINGSKSYGVLVSPQNILPVYKAVYNLPEFFSTEFNYIQLLKRYFEGCEINKAVLMCNNLYAVGNISDAMMDFQLTNKGRDITDSGYYRNLILLPIMEHCKLLLWTLYNDKRIIDKVKKQLKINEKKSVIVNDGFIDNAPVVFMFNFDIAKLKLFLNFTSLNKAESYIVTYDFYVPIIQRILNTDKNIKIIKIKTEELEKRCNLNEITKL